MRLCVSHCPEQEIAGGTHAHAHTHEYVSLLRRTVNGDHIAISDPEKWIVTAPALYLDLDPEFAAELGTEADNVMFEDLTVPEFACLLSLLEQRAAPDVSDSEAE